MYHCILQHSHQAPWRASSQSSSSSLLCPDSASTMSQSTSSRPASARSTSSPPPTAPPSPPSPSAREGAAAPRGGGPTPSRRRENPPRPWSGWASRAASSSRAQTRCSSPRPSGSSCPATAGGATRCRLAVQSCAARGPRFQSGTRGFRRGGSGVWAVRGVVTL